MPNLLRSRLLATPLLYGGGIFPAGAAAASRMQTFVGSFNTGTAAAGSTVQVTGVGFRPKAVIFWWVGRTDTTDAVGGADHFRGMGWAAGTSARAACFNYVADGAGTSASDRAQRTDACVGKMTTTTGIDGLLDLQSFDADGFTLVVDDNFSVSMRVHYMALGGDAITDVATGTFNQATSTGNQDITSVGFQPDCLLVMSNSQVADPPSTATVCAFVFGAATATGQASIMGISLDGNSGGGSGSGAARTGEVFIGAMGNTTSNTNRATFSSFLSNGFRLNWTNADGNARRIHYLALKGGNYAVGSLNTRTDGNAITVTGLGFAPTGAMFVSRNEAATAAGASVSDDRWSVGAASSPSNRAAMALLDRIDPDPTQVATAVEHDEVYINISTSDAVQGLMDLTSFDDDGFSCVMDDPDPSAAHVWYLAVG